MRSAVSGYIVGRDAALRIYSGNVRIEVNICSRPNARKLIAAIEKMDWYREIEETRSGILDVDVESEWP